MFVSDRISSDLAEESTDFLAEIFDTAIFISMQMRSRLLAGAVSRPSVRSASAPPGRVGDFGFDKRAKR